MQILILTQGLLGYEADVASEQRDPLMVTGMTFPAGAVFPPATVRIAEPMAFPAFAMTIVVAVIAVETASAKPLLLIIPTSGADKDHVTVDVISVVELSE